MPTYTKDRTRAEEQLDEIVERHAAQEKERRENNEAQIEFRADEGGFSHGRMPSSRMNSKKKDEKSYLDLIIKNKILVGAFAAADRLAHDFLHITSTFFIHQTATSGISSTFGNTVKPHRTLQPQHEDGEYVYDAMYVSEPVFDKLMRESDIIAARLEELEALKDPEARKETQKTIKKLTAEFEMRLHPISKVYVHDFDRVLREEQEIGSSKLGKDFRVCIYACKARHDELKGIKAKIGDVYNEDPKEAIMSGDHAKGHNPAPAPSP